MLKMRVIAVLCAAVLFLMLPQVVYAAPSVTVTVAQVEAVRGEEITVPVTFSEVQDLTAIEVRLSFDASRLEFVRGVTTGIVSEMGVASATSPSDAPDEVWLSAMDLAGVSGNGDGFLLTFRVKEEAPDGLAAIRFTAYNHMLLIGADMTEAAIKTAEGGVRVNGDAAVPVTTTTVQTASVDPDATMVVTNEAGAPITRPGGAPVTVAAAQTVVDLRGHAVTDANGEAVRMPSVAVMVDQVSANPEEEVTVNVSLSAVAELSSLEIGITYDASALELVKHQGLGFVGDKLRVKMTEEGLLLQAEYAGRMSGSGDIASLTFRVKDTARATGYRLGLNPAPRLVVGTTVLTAQPFAGEICVLTDGVNAYTTDNTWVWVTVGAVSVVVVAVLLMVILRRRSKTDSDKEVTVKKRMTDVSGDE